MTTINNRQQILSLMNTAKNKIQVAVSWLTDEVFINSLQLMAKKIQVEVLLSNDILNSFRFPAIRQLQLAGGIVMKRGSQFPGQPNFMHAKLLIIDNKEVYGGSFNFTANASSNDENFDRYPSERVSYW